MQWAWTERLLEQLIEGELGVDYPRLESLHSIETISEATLPLLLRLPSLTDLYPRHWALNDVKALLSGLPMFRRIVVRPLLEDAQWWGRLVEALPLCPQLEVSSRSALPDKIFATVLRAEPLLQSLLVYQAQLQSLRCFADTPHRCTHTAAAHIRARRWRHRAR